MEKALCIVQSGNFSLPFARNTRFFLTLYYENLVVLLEANLWKCGVSLKIRYPGISTLNPIYIQPLIICQNDYLNFPTSLRPQRFLIHINWNLAVILCFNWDFLYLPVFLCIRWCFVLWCQFFVESEKSHLFLVCSAIFAF